MFKVLILLIISVAVGYLLRRYRKFQTILERTTPSTIFVLLFIFGVSIGSNQSILSNLHKDGIKAAVIAVLGVLGSILASVCFKYFSGKGGAR